MDDLFNMFDGKVVCADDGLVAKGRGKPNPDIFLVAARQMLGRDVGEGDDIEKVITETQREERRKGLVLEDAILGMQAGKRAGMNGSFEPSYHSLFSKRQSDSRFCCPFSGLGSRCQPSRFRWDRKWTYDHRAARSDFDNPK